MSLFESAERANAERAMPLAARMRPNSLADFFGQSHLLGDGQLLRKLIEGHSLGSAIFFGPPGTGKTSLARILAKSHDYHFAQLSAIIHGVKDLRKVLVEAKDRLLATGVKTILFIDEIHRFSKTQQDALLADVEEGTVILIGATTANPFFSVVKALISRSTLFKFEPLSCADIESLILYTLSDSHRGLGARELTISEKAIQFLSSISDGDARQALSILETAAAISKNGSQLDSDIIQKAVSHRATNYDATGDDHYDCASALIKSIRGSDPDAGVYWLARMLEGGEDIRFLCRRLVILASEDIGNADPNALPLAASCFQACEQIGLPESQLILSQTVTYLACAPKSNASTVAISEALNDIRKGRILPVPKHLRDSHYAGAKLLGHGDGYQYSHNDAEGISEQDYLGVDVEYYRPVDRGFESVLGERLKRAREKLKSGKAKSSDHN